MSINIAINNSIITFTGMGLKCTLKFQDHQLKLSRKTVIKLEFILIFNFISNISHLLHVFSWGQVVRNSTEVERIL